MSKLSDYIDTLDIADGDTVRSDCPMCNGKNTFSATKKQGSVLYNCYKATCPTKGGMNTGMTAAEIKAYMSSKPVPKSKEVWVPPEYVVKPTLEHSKFYRYTNRYRIGLHDLMYDVKDERVVFPIYEGTTLVDAVGRSVGDKIPKWLRYTGNADHYVIGDGKTILVVEDVVSAIVAWQEFPYMTAMALLGTNLSSKNIEKIGEYDKVIIALDPDARDKTIKYRREIELWTGLKTIALSLKDDIKYREQIDMDKLQEMQY